MKMGLKSKLAGCVLVVIVFAVGMALRGDTTVQPSGLSVSGNLDVGGGVDVSGDTDVDGDLAVYGLLRAYDGIIMWGTMYAPYLIDSTYLVTMQLEAHSGNTIYVESDLNVNGEVSSDSVNADDAYFYDLWVNSNMTAMYVSAYKMSSYGGYDPPYVLYDRQSRTNIIEKISVEVPPEKQGGAVLFFNQDTNRLETYVPNQGKFYDLIGNLVYALPRPVQPVTQYEQSYQLDSRTGQPMAWSKPVENRYKPKKGFEFDSKTGAFRSRDTGETVAKEVALEVYSESDGKHYNLKGDLISTDLNDEEKQYVTSYYFDNRTGEVKAKRQAVQDRYVIKKGYKLEPDTGRFMDSKTGQVVPKEKAVGVIKAADIIAGKTGTRQ